MEQDSIQNEYPLYCLSEAERSKPINVEVVVDGKPLTMELDTGAAVSLVSESTYQEYWPDRQLQECKTRLSTYSGEPLGIPRVEDLLATLAGGKSFTKLNMSQAYQQLVLDEDLVVVNTQRTVQIHKVTLWHCFGTRCVSEGHGEPPPAYPRCDHLYRRYTGDRSYG